MQVTHGSNVDVVTDADPNFMGRAERRGFGPAEPLPARPSPYVVTFRDGARTRWHSHAQGQLLYVLEGEGRVATRGAEAEIGPGDLVAASPGEEHWHGAADDTDMTHLALSFGETTWGDASR
ncbi:MAG TPA: cupin domain-containing protein [Candidatus Limnocylindrales bacterium]